MKIALEESKKALPNCLPNPPVGCVLVKDNKVISSGYTLEPGNMHAEISAMSKTKDSFTDVAMFVTLEPCSFVGKTGSCASAIVATDIKEVYVALIDPDSRNNGKGIKILKEANISVKLGVLEKEVSEFLNSYLNLESDEH